ncbi:MAG: putative addiction module antidote protein [Treponemataceae bacterium]|nr:putative addiction module antidote protein [Treponemataceae bacterium]
MEKLTEFDAAEYLDTEELRQGYLELVSKEGTPEDVLRAINTVARARGMTKIAKEAGISRDGLYKALSEDGNPAFITVCNILHAIGYTLTPTPISKKAL